MKQPNTQPGAGYFRSLWNDGAFGRAVVLFIILTSLLAAAMLADLLHKGA